MQKQAKIMAMGAGEFGGGGSLFSLFGFNKGGSVAKGQPVLLVKEVLKCLFQTKQDKLHNQLEEQGSPVNVNFTINNIRCNRISRYVSSK